MNSSQFQLNTHHLSIVVPVFNEKDNISPLVQRIHHAMENYDHPWELIIVDDGSSDGSQLYLQKEAERYGNYVRVLFLQRNYGQTAAMQTGIDAARGNIIVTMDGDLQNDPVDIPRMVEKLINEDLDLVAGWRKNRQDGLWLRKIPSRIANRLIGKITGVKLHDYGCSLKVYRSNIIKNIRLYGEMHRFIPAWVATKTQASRIKEVVVNHNARQAGQSKYGISRTFRVLLDLLSVYFFMRFSSRPGHFFGSLALMAGGIGGLILGYLFTLKLLGESIGGRPLLLVGVLLIIAAVQLLTTGILGELMARTYFESRENKSNNVRNDDALNIENNSGWNNVEASAPLKVAN